MTIYTVCVGYMWKLIHFSPAFQVRMNRMSECSFIAGSSFTVHFASAQHVTPDHRSVCCT